jgi:predicted DNA-binding WGR domain protein
MIKLYKRDGKQWLYWEAWDAGSARLTVHWGTVGETGRSREVAVSARENADSAIERESQEPRSQGYSELDINHHAQIVVQFKTKDAWGDAIDLDQRHQVEDILNECLGWTGNGHCDGGDIGSGTINAFSFVVDPQLAVDAIVAALTKDELIDGAIIALQKEDDYEVLWPKDFQGEFSAS